MGILGIFSFLGAIGRGFVAFLSWLRARSVFQQGQAQGQTEGVQQTVEAIQEEQATHPDKSREELLEQWRRREERGR